MDTIGYSFETFQQQDVETMREQIKLLDKKQKTPRDDRFLEVTEALFNGKVIINMAATIHKGGYFDNGFPKLALGRAKDETVQCNCWLKVVSFQIEDDDKKGIICNRRDRRYYRYENAPLRNDHNRAKTIIPAIPPQLRPKNLDNHFVLFEVDMWNDIVVTKPVPVDPILCRQIKGDMFVVEAIWDMTELEAMASGL